MQIQLKAFATAGLLARSVADAWLDEIGAADRAARPYFVALSGGRIAREFFASAAEQSKTRALSLRSAHFFWADERCVSPHDPESNFRVAQDLLFAPLEISESHVHRIRGEDPPEAAAARAEAEVRGIVPLNSAQQPVLDLIFLGMGEDGHVASLFPGQREELLTNPAVYRAVKNSPKPPPNRITLGFPAIAAARQVWVLVSGKGKEDALRDSLAPDGRTPLAEVLRLRRETMIFTDLVVDRVA